MANGLGGKGWDEAVRRIKEAARSGVEYLDLSNLGLTTIPESAGELVDLRGLNLRTNALTMIPEHLTALVQLQILDLGNNQITAIPDYFNRLSNLRQLSLAENGISVLPEFLGQLMFLEALILGHNRITVIPNTFAQLNRLQILDLDGNKITTIPDALAELSQLQVLKLSDNGITDVSDSLIRLGKLWEIHLDANPLPEELLAAAQRSVKSLFRYLRSTSKRKVYPRTVKLVLLGEPKSGKTTLLEALKGNPKPCDPERKETLGVDVVSIEKTNPEDQKPMYLSVWDFAGQHIEHATHQFFLTENAIYLILWNARQGTEAGMRDLWYWLELLKMRVRTPKFLLVATHAELTPPDLNLTDIERGYQGCQGNLAVDLETLNGFDALQNKILELAAESPSLRAEWPAAWLPVRDEIREIRKDKPYVSPSDFRGLMTKKGVTEPQAQIDLGNQLHDLGEILYFQERDELSSLVILNPEWVTELIAYLDSKRAATEPKNGGLQRHLVDDGRLLWLCPEHLKLYRGRERG
jgi:internalin A